MKFKTAIFSVALFFGAAGIAGAAYNYINQLVGVCDPASVTHCVKPDANGNTPVTNDGVSDGATVTASVSSAAPVITIPDTTGYGYIMFGFTSVGAGNTIVVDGAADGSTFNATGVFWRADAINTSIVSSENTPSTTRQYIIPVFAKGVRIRVSVYGSGTVTVYATLKRGAAPQPTQLTIGGLPSLVASGSADSGGPVKVGCKYNSTLPTFTNGQRADCQADANGLLMANVHQALPPISVALSLTGSYAVGNDMGGLIQISTGLNNTLVEYVSLQVCIGAATFTAGSNNALSFRVFEGNPSGSTFTDAVNAVTVAADAPKVRRWVNLAAQPAQTNETGPTCWIQVNTTTNYILTDGSGKFYLALIADGTMTMTTPYGYVTVIVRKL